MSKILIPSQSAEDWKQFLAEPEKHWKRGYSARAIAYCWQEADGLPDEVRSVLTQEPAFEGLETLIAIPEHKVMLNGGSRPSQNDVWVIARTKTSLVSIAVEGKVSESFGPTMAEWGINPSGGKLERLHYLCSVLGLKTKPDDDIRDQFLHRTASAIIEAIRFHANHAVMLVHSFSEKKVGFADYERFLSLFNVVGEVDKIISAGQVSGVNLYFAWVRGNESCLEK
ncbi:MAG: hypothetical protein AAB332_04860 [Planctomycetota bacterium]